MRILLVDDDQQYLSTLQRSLHTLEPTWKVTVAANADVARAAVKQAAVPFDVFLLDQRLDGSDVDGVTLMQELRALSPDSDAIILTGYDEIESGLRAFEHGAHRFLIKPFKPRELFYILKTLNQVRGIRAERDWLQILSGIAKKMQDSTGMEDVADVIVRGGLGFGFRRARLWLYDSEPTDEHDRELAGVAEAGHSPPAGIKEIRRPLNRMIYSQTALQGGRPHFFTGRELGPGGADDAFGPRNVIPPVGDWVEIPILSKAGGIGALALDNDDAPAAYQPLQRELLTKILGLFGEQAGLALERAGLHDKLDRQAAEAQILSAIGRRVTASAAKADLSAMLDDLRGQLRDSMGIDVTNFIVVLLDKESGYLDFRRQYEEGQLYPRYWRKHPEGLCSEVINDGRSALLPHGSDAFRRERRLPLFGRQSESWLGVPLILDGQTIGAIVVQDYEHQEAYTEQHKRLLEQVAGQVAGAISVAYKLEREAEGKCQDSATATLRSKLPQLIWQSVDSFWHALLTTITHRDGYSFNRAVLFRFDETGTRLQGRMGIGQLLCEEAHRVWEADERDEYHLHDYFENPYLALDKPTPLQQRALEWVLPVADGDSPCHEIWTKLTPLIVPSTALANCLPLELLNPPDLPPELHGFDCGLLPVKLRDRAYGLLVVDNFTDGEPLRADDLHRLENLLAEAGHIWEQYRETDQIKALGDDVDKLLTVERLILAGASDLPLRESLHTLCINARTITKADSVVIYPYHALHAGYDLESVAHEGLRSPDQFTTKTKNKPRQRGVSFAISQSGTLVVPDVANSDLAFGGRPLKEHHFIERERVRAVIGVPMRQVETGESLGVVYLNYWSPRRFTEPDVVRAEHLAKIGATCISYLRELERGKRTTQEAEERLHLRDMQLLNNVSTLAQAPYTDEKSIIQAILQNTTEMFDPPAKVTLGLVEWLSSGESRVRARRDYALGGDRGLSSHRVHDPGQGLIGAAITDSTPQRSGNYLAWPIAGNQRPIGALLLRKYARKERFTSTQEQTIAQLAHVAALALENVHNRDYLKAVSKTMSKVSDATGLEETLQGVLKSARQVAPDIDCVTLWYEDAEDRQRLVAGPSWGVRNDNHEKTILSSNRVVREVMRRRTPLFAPVAERERSLEGEFLKSQGIASVAALPLAFGETRKPFGALFLNYRQAHEFTSTEHTLFPFFANAAAAAIHDAQAIDLAEKQRKRFETAIKIANSAGASYQMDEVLRAILATLRDEFSRDTTAVSSPYIMLYNEDDDLLSLHPVSRDFYQPAPGYESRESLSLHEPGISTDTARKALERGGIYIENVKEVSSNERYVEESAPTRSQICAGLVSEGRLLGVLVIKSPRPAAFDEEDEKLFDMAAQQVIIALHRLEQGARLQLRSIATGRLAWAADIAHDLGRSVGRMRALLYRLREREPGLSPEGIALSRVVEKSLEPLAHVTLQGSPRLENFSLMDVLLEDMDEWLENNASGVSVEHNMNENTPRVYADRMQTEIVLRYLLLNAIEAMETMEGLESPRISLSVRPNGKQQLELLVEDTGPGLSEDVRQKLLFEPHTTKPNPNGDRGNGLLFAQLLVESMNGRIRPYRTIPGKGAVFGMCLPLATTGPMKEETHD